MLYLVRKKMIKKKKLILLPGDITSSFFLNELSYLNNCFDEIVILAFGKKTNETQKIVEQYG